MIESIKRNPKLRGRLKKPHIAWDGHCWFYVPAFARDTPKHALRRILNTLAGRFVDGRNR